MIHRINALKPHLLSNGSYKVVAFFVALVVWVVVLGRDEYMYMRNLPLKVNLKDGLELVSGHMEIAEVRVSGPKLIIRKLEQVEEGLPVDLRGLEPGVHHVRVIDLLNSFPVGVRVDFVKPTLLTVSVKEKRDQ